ncbi:MAG: Fic family protein [Faecalicoccus sp.]|uniref:Fic family protein n=1 Tax=Faecalicoccus sp. TaxID=1971758 RepID=UPI002A800ED7|nr:Fic family protein [Faecalicoccus sp.]MDY4869387.1 Fic family protein [Faecalicoccus sp.]MDY5232738.1 Fic family protein [Faecalicoccus sp.]
MKFTDAIKESKEYYENFITRSVNDSNRIEGNTLSYVETYAIIFNDNSFTLKNAKPREIYEAINLKYALTESLRILNTEQNEMSASFIIRINEIINKNIKDTSGFRKIPVFINGADFVPCAAADVPRRMQELLYLYRTDQRPLLERIADFHIQFEHIHPFEDGNGRTGRVLINHELIRNNETPIVIPQMRRTEYFEYLSNYDTDSMVRFFKELQEVEEQKIEQYCGFLEEQADEIAQR